MLCEGERGGAHFPPGCQSEAVELPFFLPVSVDFRWMDELIHEKTEEDFLTPCLPHFPLSQSVLALNMPAC